jgi:hypothetical protein
MQKGIAAVMCGLSSAVFASADCAYGREETALDRYVAAFDPIYHYELEIPTPLWPSSQLATGLSPLAPRSGLERSDFVHWHRRDD